MQTIALKGGSRQGSLCRLLGFSQLSEACGEKTGAATLGAATKALLGGFTWYEVLLKFVTRLYPLYTATNRIIDGVAAHGLLEHFTDDIAHAVPPEQDQEDGSDAGGAETRTAKGVCCAIQSRLEGFGCSSDKLGGGCKETFSRRLERSRKFAYMHRGHVYPIPRAAIAILCIPVAFVCIFTWARLPHVSRACYEPGSVWTR